MSHPKPFREFCLAAVAIAVLLCASFYDVVFFGKTFKVTTANPQALSSGPYGQEQNKPKFFPVTSTDSSMMEEPFYEFVRRSLRAGEIPLWNPHQACGYPFIAMLELGIFFPLNFVLYVLPSLYAWDVMIFLRFLLGGLFTYAFMRTLRYKPVPSLGSAIAFTLSGPMVLLQYLFTNVEILTPLVLLALERLVRHPRLPSAGLVAVAVAATFYAGHPEHVFFVNLFAGLYVVFRVLTVRPRPPLGRVSAVLAAGYLLGLGLSAMVLFPFLRNLHAELWHNHPPLIGLKPDGLPLSRLITLASPYFFQKEPVNFEFTPAGWLGGYVGFLPLALAFIGLFRNQRRGLNYFFFLAAFLNISKSYFGFPFINWIGYLPILRDCRFFVHTGHLFAFSVAILAGMGIKVILNDRKAFVKSLSVVLPLALMVAGYLWVYRQAAHFPLSLHAGLWAVGALTALSFALSLKNLSRVKNFWIGGLVLLLLTGELFGYIHRGRVNRFDSYPKVPYIEAMKKSADPIRAYGIFWTFHPNTASGYGVNDFGVASGLLPRRYVNFVNNFLIEGYFQQDLKHASLWAIPITLMPGPRPYLDLLNIAFTVAPAQMPATIPPQAVNIFAKTVYSGEAALLFHASAYPRAFIVHKAEFEPDETSAVAKIKLLRNNLRQVAVIHHPAVPEIVEQLQAVPLSDGSSARIVKYTANDVIVEANMEHAGFLMLGDSYHPDWTADVGGKPTQIFFADGLIRAVFLPPGLHTVRFRFAPVSFYAGALLSLLSLAAVLAFALRSRIQGRP
ncbi:MAG: YfhO family protein [Candidatus Omnitrophota bacterium]|nr:YfhO family protein [Candidatus Omnitrophota bacterium]MDZ4242882.1 YfhO family protein [Candidatus Omnitrophota bacterium]